MRLSAAASAVMATPALFKMKMARAQEGGDPVFDSIVGVIEDGVGLDYSPTTGAERKVVPSACWQCVARDGILCFVEDGRLEHIEGNPKLLRTNGKLCPKGQAGADQVYDPDRLMFPMKRVGKRGEGKWKKISWDEAINELGGKLKELKDAGTPEKFMFHYGRMKASASKIIKSFFLTGYGTGTIGNHTAICESAKWTAQEITWGKHYDVCDVENAGMILIFGSNPLETHTNHLPLAQRILGAIGKGTKVVTVDPRLSNTAARSSQWIPIKPGTDLAVMLAMCYHIVDQGLVPTEGKDFVNNWGGTTMADLTDFLNNPKDHVPDNLKGEQPAGGYTPDWAAGLSGVDAGTIKTLAEEYAAASPGSCMIAYRGVSQHYNGVQGERASLMLDALLGNINVVGGRVYAVGAPWSYKKTYPAPSSSGVKKLKIIDGDTYALPSHHASHQVLRMIKDNPDMRPEIYMSYCYTPVYANGNVQENIDILKDETMIPYSVNCNTSYDESAALADLILPDATYLERWDYEDMVSMNMVPEYYIRQPAVGPLGEARDFKDVLYPLAEVIGDADLIETMKFKTAEEFVKAACNDTEDVKAVGGFEYMKEHGAYVPDVEPKYMGHMKEVDPGDYHLDDATGAYWDATQNEDGTWPDYRTSSKSYKKYKGQKIGDKAYAGFKPDKLNKSGLFELWSPLLDAKGWPGFPAWMMAPEHKNMADDELILTTFKVSTQIHSRSQNCKYLTELYHDNPGWMNPVTAEKFGVKDGDEVELTPQTMDNGGVPASSGGSMKFVVKVTNAILPGVFAVSHHLGHWEYGRYASGNKNPLIAEQADHEAGDRDLGLKWWDTYGRHPNWVIPNAGDPIGGSLRFMDTVVKVAKA